MKILPATLGPPGPHAAELQFEILVVRRQGRKSSVLSPKAYASSLAQEQEIRWCLPDEPRSSGPFRRTSAIVREEVSR